MTREEAAKKWEWVVENFNDSVVFLWPDQRQKLIESISLLRNPTPDPITGLVPCGCGGKAKLYHRHSTILPKQILWVVQCVKFGKCGISTPDCTRKQDAIALWNLAMGYRA